MIKALDPSQRALAEYMSDLSEQAYYAGWMHDLEYNLWEVAKGSRKKYGVMEFAAEHAEKLTRLSAQCGGWIFFDDKNEETWISVAEWEKRYATWRTDPNLERLDG